VQDIKKQVNNKVGPDYISLGRNITSLGRSTAARPEYQARPAWQPHPGWARASSPGVGRFPRLGRPDSSAAPSSTRLGRCTASRLGRHQRPPAGPVPRFPAGPVGHRIPARPLPPPGSRVLPGRRPGWAAWPRAPDGPSAGRPAGLPPGRCFLRARLGRIRGSGLAGISLRAAKP
jgi:hypothetical protein